VPVGVPLSLPVTVAVSLRTPVDPSTSESPAALATVVMPEVGGGEVTSRHSLVTGSPVVLSDELGY
jgi:hypothetical protein